jgi:hypothetical protein
LFQGFISGTQSKLVMPLNFLGKVLFPRLEPWRRKRQAKAIMWAVLTALIFAAVVVGIMFLENSRR